jgi:hypothetical protein
MSNVFNDQVVFNNGTQTYGNSSVSGDLEVAGNIDGNVTGNLTGNVTGNVTGNLTGNVDALGISTFTAGVNIGSGTSIFSPSSNILTLGINNSEKIRVTTTGIGIGTNFITRPFEVWAGTVAGTASTSFSVDGSGRVLNSSAQPYFYARGPESNTTLTNGADLNFNNAIINNGNHYNTSTYRFTAPVGGRYLFTWSLFVNTATGRCTLKVNNSSYNNLQMDVGGGFSQSVILQLSPNDYVSVGDWQSISGGVFYMGHSHFSGILLG